MWKKVNSTLLHDAIFFRKYFKFFFHALTTVLERGKYVLWKINNNFDWLPKWTTTQEDKEQTSRKIADQEETITTPKEKDLTSRTSKGKDPTMTMSNGKDQILKMGKSTKGNQMIVNNNSRLKKLLKIKLQLKVLTCNIYQPFSNCWLFQHNNVSLDPLQFSNKSVNF